MSNSRFDWWLNELAEKGDYYRATVEGDEFLVLAMGEPEALAMIRDHFRNELKDVLIQKLEPEAVCEWRTGIAQPIPDDFMPEMKAEEDSYPPVKPWRKSRYRRTPPSA